MSSPLNRIPSPFLIGITGHMDLKSESGSPNDHTELKRRLHVVFEFLKFGPVKRQSDGRREEKDLLEAMVQLLAENPTDRDSYRHALACWPGLPSTPIVLMCGLAPGADLLVAEVAIEHGIQVRGVLPFEEGLYETASTFVRVDRRPDGTETPSAGNEERQTRYRDLLAKTTNPFDVRLCTDIGLSRDRLLKQMIADRGDQGARHKRYYAAGEYLAVMPHLMLAIWNRVDDGSLSGTSAIVKARLNGPLPNILPTSRGLRIPHGGPLLVVFAEREKVSTPVELTTPPMDFRHPQQPNLEDAEGSQDGQLSEHHGANPESADSISEQIQKPNDLNIANRRHRLLMDWQTSRLALFSRVAMNLDRFNKSEIQNPRNLESEFQARISIDGHSELFPCSGATVEVCQLKTGLRQISDLRSCAADLQRQHERSVEFALKWMFRLTLTAAILWHVFCHWHPRPPKTNAKKSSTVNAVTTPASEPDAHDDPSPATSGDHEQHSFSVARCWIGGLAFFCSAGAIAFLVWQATCQSAEQGHDCRALAEGLRVQFYWNLAGLGESVSSNYMHRQRSELDWIRGAIRAISYPYHQWQGYYANLQDAVKLQVFKAVHHGWIVEQFHFFDVRYMQHHWRLHAWHKLGRLLASSSVLSGFFIWIGIVRPATVSFLNSPWWLGGWWLMIIAVSVAWYLVRRSTSDDSHDQHATQKSSPWESFAQAVVFDYESLPIGLRRLHDRYRPLQLMFSFARFAPATVLLACINIAISFTAASLFSETPSADDWGIILTGSLLVSGALSVAWAEKKLYSEIASQYQTMRALFLHADEHFKREIELLERELKTGGSTVQRVEQMQQFLYALGKESLDENAEWLLLHRARPLEPVLAG